MPRGSASSRRRRVEAGGRRETARSRLAEASAEEEPVVMRAAVVIAPQPASRETEESPSAPRFRIFIIDSGWDSPGHKVLQENFVLLRDFQKEDPIYLLGKEKSIEYLSQHQERIGQDRIIAVHDLAAMGETAFSGAAGSGAAAYPARRSAPTPPAYAGLPARPNQAENPDASRSGARHRTRSGLRAG